MAFNDSTNFIQRKVSNGIFSQVEWGQADGLLVRVEKPNAAGVVVITASSGKYDVEYREKGPTYTQRFRTRRDFVEMMLNCGLGIGEMRYAFEILDSGDDAVINVKLNSAEKVA